MNKKIQFNQLKLGIPVLLILFLVFLSRTAVFQNAPAEMSLGILLDLLISVPLVYYFVIRKTKIPKFTVIYPFLIGLFLASFIIPIEHQDLLSQIKFVAIPLIEIGILSTLIYKVITLRTSLKKTKNGDFYDRLLMACEEVFPNRVGKILATEIAVMYYLLAPPSTKVKQELEFTYFKKSGIKSVIGVFLCLVAMETAVVHLLVSKWNVMVAWILSFIGVYTILQIIAILRSMNKRFISIDQETESLELKYGFGCQSSIPFQSIKRIEKSRKSRSNDKNHVCLSLFDLIDSTNVIIYLNDENTLYKIYGIEKKYTSISLFVDEIDLFVDQMEEHIFRD